MAARFIYTGKRSFPGFTFAPRAPPLHGSIGPIRGAGPTFGYGRYYNSELGYTALQVEPKRGLGHISSFEVRLDHNGPAGAGPRVSKGSGLAYQLSLDTITWDCGRDSLTGKLADGSQLLFSTLFAQRRPISRSGSRTVRCDS